MFNGKVWNSCQSVQFVMIKQGAWGGSPLDGKSAMSASLLTLPSQIAILNDSAIDQNISMYPSTIGRWEAPLIRAPRGGITYKKDNIAIK